jgi:hypothetical protein
MQTGPAPQPEARVELRPGRARGKVAPGGTSVSSGPPILLIAGAALIVLIIIIVIASGGDDGKTGAVAEPDAAVEVVEPRDGDEERPNGPDAPSPQLRDAVYALSQAMKAEKVISTVNIAPAQPSIILISSVYCSDKTLASVLSEHTSKLRSLGVTLVRCFSRDGAVVFEKQL